MTSHIKNQKKKTKKKTKRNMISLLFAVHLEKNLTQRQVMSAFESSMAI